VVVEHGALRRVAPRTAAQIPTPTLSGCGSMSQTGGHCSFSFAEKEKWLTLPQTFQAQKEIWVSAKLGLFSTKPLLRQSGGHADFDYFRFS